MKRLGFLDWGVGGLSVVRRIRGRASLHYLSDTGAPPYGTLPAPALRDRIEHIARLLLESAPHALVVACNAASTVAPNEVDGVPVFDVISPALAMLNQRAPSKLGVIGGGQTIASGAYQNGLRHTVVGVVAQPLSALVERGELEGEEVTRAVHEVLERVGSVDTLVLACTHYPALAPVFRRLRPELPLFDPAQALEQALSAAGLLTPEPQHASVDEVFVTTGDPEAMVLAAHHAFRVSLGLVRTRAIPFPKLSAAASKQV